MHQIPLLYLIYGIFWIVFFAACQAPQKPLSVEKEDYLSQGAVLENQDYEKAIAFYQSIFSKNKTTGQQTDSTSLLNSGLRLTQLHNYQVRRDSVAIKILDTLEMHFQKAPVALSQIYLKRALLAGKTPEALVHLHKADSLITQIPRPTPKWRQEYHLTAGLHYFARWKQFFPLAMEHLQIAANDVPVGDPEMRSIALINLGMIHFAENRVDSANWCQQEVLRLNKGTQGKFQAQIWAYFQLGRMALTRGDHDFALSHYKKTNTLNEQIGLWPSDHPFSINIFNNLSVCYKETGDLEKAILYADRVIQFYQDTGLSCRIGGKIMNKAAMLKDLEKYNEAITLNSEVIPQLRSCKDTVNLISALNNQGILQTSLGDYTASEKSHRESMALKIQKHGRQHRFVVKSLNNLAELYLQQNKLSEALQQIEEAYSINQSMGNRYRTLAASSLTLFGNILRKQQKTQQAIDRYEQAIQVLFLDTEPGGLALLIDSSVVSRYDLIEPLSAKARLHFSNYRKNKDSKEGQAALDLFTISIEIIDQIRRGYTSSGSKEFLLNSVYPIFEDAITCAIEQGHQQQDHQLFDLGFGFLEQSKYVLLKEALAASKAKLGAIPDSLIVRERALKRKIDDTERMIFEAESGQSEAVDKARTELFNLKTEIEKLQEGYKTEYPKYYALDNPSLTGVKELQTYLGKLASPTAIVEYFLREKQLTIFCITSNSFEVKTILLPDSFYQDLFTFRTLLNRPPTGAAGSKSWQKNFEAIANLGRKFYRSLLSPVDSIIGERDLLIIPDKELGYLPFQVLLAEEADSSKGTSYLYRQLPYLMRNREIRYEYSASLLEESNPEVQYAKAYVGFAPEYGNNAEEGNIVNLTYNKEEVQEAAQILRGQPFVNEEATERNFKSQALDAGILHLSMHGLVNHSEPLYSQLVFTSSGDSLEDDRLQAYELYNLELKADLAVLSACNTGLGKLEKGEGILSLSRAFKYAGCPNIVMSLWPANDQSSKDIMGVFFRQLKEGQAKSYALDEARRNYLWDMESVSTEKTHPFYWANFVLIGNDLPIKIAGGSSVWWWLLPVLLVLVFFFRKRF